MIRRAALSSILLMCGVGCVTVERGHFAALATAPLPASPAMVVVKADAEGRVCGGVFQDPLRRAVEDALQKSPGANALTDVRYGFREFCMVVTGTAVRSP